MSYIGNIVVLGVHKKWILCTKYCKLSEVLLWSLSVKILFYIFTYITIVVIVIYSLQTNTAVFDIIA